MSSPGLAPALLDEQPERDPRARLHLLEAHQPRQLAGRLAADLAHAADACAGRSASAERAMPALDAAGQLEAVAEALADLGRRSAPRPRRRLTASSASGSSPAPARQRAQPATRRPGRRRSRSSRRRGRSGPRAAPARRPPRAAPPGVIARTPAAGAIWSTVPTTDRIGHSMSASVTSTSSTTKPPSSIRLCATNWLRKSAIAGPGHATQPSASRKRRWPSRGSSASRSCSCRMNSIRLRIDLTGSSSRKLVRLAHAGSAQLAEQPLAEHAGGTGGDARREARTASPRACRPELPNVISELIPALRR